MAQLTRILGSRVAVALVSVVVTALVFSGGVAVALNVPDNSVNSAKIVDNSVRSIDIQDGTLQSVDIATGGVRGVDIANGTVHGADLDWAPFQLVLQLFAFETVGDSGSPGSVRATCPAGKRAVAGGGRVTSEANDRPSEPFLVASYPTSTGWTTEWAYETGEGPGIAGISVWAFCIPT
jgi:hypothetical protein